MPGEINFEIKKRIGILSESPKGWTKELNLISWYGAAPKYDLRDWSPDHKKMGKGVTLTEGEFQKLRELLGSINGQKPDMAAIARHIWDEDMGLKKKADYMNSLWNSADDEMRRLFSGRKIYFWHKLDMELMKISNPDIFEDENNARY